MRLQVSFTLNRNHLIQQRRNVYGQSVSYMREKSTRYT